MKKEDLSFEELNNILSYDPLTGLLRWKVKTCKKVMVGSIAGSLSDGYIYVCHKQIDIAGHHLAWFLTHKKWPTGLIDHKNRIRSDNRLDNLREATYSQNNVNKQIRSDNTTGVTGISFDKARNKYCVRIYVNGKREFYKRFDTLDQAIVARQEAEKEFHKEFSPLTP